MMTISCNAQNKTEMKKDQDSFDVVKSEQEWQKQLSAENTSSFIKHRASANKRIQHALEEGT